MSDLFTYFKAYFSHEVAAFQQPSLDCYC